MNSVPESALQKNNWFKSNPLLTFIVSTIALCIIALIIVTNLGGPAPTAPLQNNALTAEVPDNSSQSNVVANASKPVIDEGVDEVPEKKVPKYQIVWDDTPTWQVYTESTSDEGLIAVADDLLTKPREIQSHFYVDFFNDLETARVYRDKKFDESVPDAEMDELYAHFTARLIYNESTGYKQLERVYGVDALTIIKKY